MKRAGCERFFLGSNRAPTLWFVVGMYGASRGAGHSENTEFGVLHEVRRKIGRWKKQPDPGLDRKLQLTTKYKVCPFIATRGR